MERLTNKERTKRVNDWTRNDINLNARRSGKFVFRSSEEMQERNIEKGK